MRLKCRHWRAIISAVAGDDSVQFFWTMLSVDIDGEKQADKMLKEIVRLGDNKIAGTCMDETILTCHYKSKGLGKELKRSRRLQQRN